jgi:predicted enzyme related to lactoylglutathione lyase
MENTPIPEIGAFSMLQDPAGATFALFQPNMGPRGTC